jgi:hypothetical protein
LQDVIDPSQLLIIITHGFGDEAVADSGWILEMTGKLFSHVGNKF